MATPLPACPWLHHACRSSSWHVVCVWPDHTLLSAKDLNHDDKSDACPFVPGPSCKDAALVREDFSDDRRSAVEDSDLPLPPLSSDVFVELGHDLGKVRPSEAGRRP